MINTIDLKKKDKEVDRKYWDIGWSGWTERRAEEDQKRWGSKPRGFWGKRSS